MPVYNCIDFIFLKIRRWPLLQPSGETDQTSLTIIISQMINLGLRESYLWFFPCLLLQLFLESESWNFTLNGRTLTIQGWWGKGHVWIHESGWWQLMWAFLQSHRTSPSPPAPHLGALNYIHNHHEQTSAWLAMRCPHGYGNASLAFPEVVPRVLVVCSSFSWSFRISVWVPGLSLPNFYLVSLITDWVISQMDRKLYCEWANNNKQDWLGTCYLGSLGYKYLSDKCSYLSEY